MMQKTRRMLLVVWVGESFLKASVTLLLFGLFNPTPETANSQPWFLLPQSSNLNVRLKFEFSSVFVSGNFDWNDASTIAHIVCTFLKRG